MARERKEPIPGTLNLIVGAIAVAIAMALLWFVSHSPSWPWRIVAAIAFSYINNTIFSLLHESVHGIAHRNRCINDWYGRTAAAFFPTAFTFQRMAHLGHHRRNRTEAELFDYYRPGDNLVIKYLQWYGILTGLYWLLIPFACLAYLLAPGLLNNQLVRGEESTMAQQTGADAMLSGIDRASSVRIRLEILYSIAIQAVLFVGLDLTVTGWLICYAAFALNWCSLQYADHAWSDRDVVDGAWNLRVSRVVQWLFLNYHHHKAHHQHPQVPWTRLHTYVDPDEYRPSFFRIYLRMWLGPRPLPESREGITSKGMPVQRSGAG